MPRACGLGMEISVPNGEHVRSMAEKMVHSKSHEVLISQRLSGTLRMNRSYVVSCKPECERLKANTAKDRALLSFLIGVEHGYLGIKQFGNISEWRGLLEWDKPHFSTTLIKDGSCDYHSGHASFSHIDGTLYRQRALCAMECRNNVYATPVRSVLNRECKALRLVCCVPLYGILVR